ncbi:MAG: hypothetical protein U1F43_17440 [Myxococcota bacterium]
MRTALTSSLVALGLLACNHTPIANLEKSFTLKVEAGTGNGERIKIDFLWVVDNSTSMCQEQAGLARSFKTFADTLEQSFKVDAHIAVTSVAAQCPNDGTTIFAGRGTFNTHASQVVPVACGEEVRMACEGSGAFCSDGLDCSILGECDSNQPWSCQRRQSDPSCTQNSNGTFNESCRRTCKSDEECRIAFNDDTMRCLNSAAPRDDTTCVRVPAATGCPETLPPILEKNDTIDNTNLFPCLANVGLSSGTPCFHYEEQLRSALLAIDPIGPNSDQSLAFLRPDAYLVIIIVSDEEDCSVSAGREGMINEAQGGSTAYDKCGLYPTTDDNGPLVPVAHYVNQFKSLKSDPSRVIVATIAGDTLKTDPADVVAAHDAYVSSKSEPKTCHVGTYICESENGVADWGRRLIEFATSFGPNGTFENICGSEGIGPALTRIADAIISVVNRVCLPKPILSGLKVTRTRGDVTEELTEAACGSGPGTFCIVQGAEDCAVDDELLPAISFFDRPAPDDKIDITYQGDPELP